MKLLFRKLSLFLPREVVSGKYEWSFNLVIISKLQEIEEKKFLKRLQYVRLGLVSPSFKNSKQELMKGTKRSSYNITTVNKTENIQMLILTPA